MQQKQEKVGGDDVGGGVRGVRTQRDWSETTASGGDTHWWMWEVCEGRTLIKRRDKLSLSLSLSSSVSPAHLISTYSLPHFLMFYPSNFSPAT